MAINDTKTFDPSKRIRAAFGEEEAEQLELDAVNRLAEAMASNGMRRSQTQLEEDNMGFIDNLVKNITHTNPIKPKTEEIVDVFAGMDEEEIAKVQLSSVSNTKDQFMSMLEKKPFVENAVRTLTGFGTKDSKASNVEQLARVGVKNISNLITTDMVETALRGAQNKTKLALCACAAAADFGTQTVMSGNKHRLTELFNPKTITLDEAAAIDKAILKEKVKYGLQHTAASVVAPAVAKFAIDKALGDKVRENKVVDVATSFGVLSTIGKVSLSIGRRIAEKKSLTEVVGKDYINEGTTPKEAYTKVAKLAINRMINETMDDTLLSTALGTYIGLNSWDFSDEPQENATTSSIIKGFKDKVAVENIVNAPQEPVVEEKKAAVPPKSKKTA